jgi:dienelactone hydrolase
MKSPRTSRRARFLAAALPLALSSCSSDDSPIPSQPESFPALTPAAPDPDEADAPAAETGTPPTSPGDVDPAMPETQTDGTPLAPAGNAGAPGAVGVLPSSCVGEAWPTADPTSAGPFQVSVDRDVGPLAGFLPDPVYGDVQQRFNIYRPSNLDSSGLCHPILVWANGRGDNPEQHPPECIVNPATNTWCGTYPGLMNQLASHGFVVIASLSTTTSRGEPLPTIAGLDWLLEQAEDATSPYFHHIDTARIGALGHSEGGASTSIAAADPRISAIATICGSRALTGLHGPALFTCGGLDTVVPCDSVANTFNSVTDQPAMFMNNLAADHGSWLGQNGSQGPTFFALTAWFRVHLMSDEANRRFFFGPDCALCTDSRVAVQRNGLMTQ